MDRQRILIALALIGGIALGTGGSMVVGAAGNGNPAEAIEEARAEWLDQLRVVEADRDAMQLAVLETQERLAGLAQELNETRATLDAIRAEQAFAEADALFGEDAYWDDEADETLAATDEPAAGPAPDTREARGAPEDRGGRWDPERIAEMRAERDERVRGFFDDALDRAPSRESQERIAAIEAYTQDAMELMREWRGASESEREELREQMGAMRDTMRDLVREEHDARVREVAARVGVSDANQQQALADAIREVQRDPIFRGGAWGGGGRGSGPAPMWGGRRGGGQPGR